MRPATPARARRAAAAEPVAARRDLRAARHRAVAPGHAARRPSRHAGGLGAAAHRAGRFLPPARAHAARRRRTAARRAGRAPGKHRLRAARAGRNGGRVFGARRHPRRVLARSAEAGAHRAVRRPGGVHPPLRSGVAAVRAEGGRLHAAAADRVSEVARACWRS